MSPLIMKIVLAAILMALWTYRAEILGVLGGMLPNGQSASDDVSETPDAKGSDTLITPVVRKPAKTTITMEQLLQITSERPSLFRELLPLALPKKVRELYEQDEFEDE